MSGSSNSGKTIIGCFFIFFAFAAISMGFTGLSFGAPPIFAVVTFGIAGFVILLMGAVLRGGGHPSRPYSGADFVPVKKETTIGYRPSAEQRKIVYQSPSQCPKCGASLSSESVDWVGPLQVVCPYCNATVDAVERSI